MAGGMLSIKRTLIAKSNTTIVVITSGACFIVVFCAVASLSLLSQLSYQNRVIGADKDALKQLRLNVQAAQNLAVSYSAFTSTPTNIIGGDPHGSGQQDGDNTKIVLDALPSKYDFPALATSLENLLNNQGVEIQSIGGTDDAANQANNQSSSSPAPQPIPFQIQVQGDYNAIQRVIGAFDRSVRPFQIQTLQLGGDQNKLTLTITAQTFWQPTRDLSNRTKVVK
jgi:hypothetical protein